MNDKILVTRSVLPPFEEYMEMIKPLWDTHWITNMGDYHKLLEQKLKEYLKVDKLSLMVNGHMALEMAIQAMNFPKGGEVITTPYTFISTTHAIVRNSLKPVFCDIKPNDFTIDEEKIEDLITENTVAIVAVHVYGNLCAVHKIEEIAYKYGLKVIYDAAHAFGERYQGKGIGIFGDASIFSFHATKIFNTIEGGAVSFQGGELEEKLYNLKNFGIRGEELVVSVGANAKMNEFCAAMGLCNLNYISQEIQNRKRAAETYLSCLADIPGLTFNSYSMPSMEYNYAYFPVLFDEEILGCSRDIIKKELSENNIFTRKYFYPITSEQACFKKKYSSAKLPTARKTAEQVLTLPMYGGLSVEQVCDICDVIRKVIKRYTV